MNNRIECAPRIIKRTTGKEQTDDALKYGFYRQINHLSIIKLNDETDKMNYSAWLTKLDTDSSDLKMHLIKLLFISLRSDRSFKMFLKPPPDDLKDIELKFDNTMDMVKHLQDNNKVEESSTSEDKDHETRYRRSAAVGTDLRSYTTIKASPYFVQSFYVRSDFPIYTWFNPTSIRLPSSFNHNEWELFLNQFQTITENKDFNNKVNHGCDDIIPIDQETKEVEHAFSWHPYSIFKDEANRPKRTAASIEIDLDVSSQQCNQQQIDDAAFSIVLCKVFPGNKILSKKMYTCTLMPDAKFIFKMTGVTLVDYSNLKLKNSEQLPNACILRQRKRAKNSCEDKDDAPRKKPTIKICCSKPQLLLPCSQIVTKFTKTTPNKVNTENVCDMQECGINYSKCPKKGVKKAKAIECCKFPKEADLDTDNTNESTEPDKCPTTLNAGRSSLNDSSKCDWTVSSVEISMRESDRASSSSPPPVEKAPDFNANCAALLAAQVTPVEPEDQSKRHCSNVQLAEAAATPPQRCPRTAESSREPSKEHHSRRSCGNSDISERTVKSGCTDTSCISGRSRTPSVQERSVSDFASARGERSASDCGQKVGQCPAKCQNFTCPAAFTEQLPLTPKRPQTDTPDSCATQRQQQQQRQPQQQYQPQKPHQPQQQYQPQKPRQPQQQYQQQQPRQPQQQYQQQQPRQPPQQHQHQPLHLYQQQHIQQQQQQQKHQQQQQQHQQQQHQYQNQSAVSSNNRSAASVAAAAAVDWDPEVSSYAAFSDRRITEDQSRFMTSERMIDRRLSMGMRPQQSPPQSPANDFRGSDYDDDLSGSSAEESDWSVEEGVERCESCVMQDNRFRGVGDDNNYNDSSSSLSTLTSSDSSIDLRLAARHVPNDNVNYDRRTDCHSTNNNDRYPFDGRLTPTVSDISLRGNEGTDFLPAAIFDLVENVSMPGSDVIGPWSLSSNASRSGRVQEFGDVRALDPYDTPCSDGGNASGRDDYVDRPHNSFGAFGTNNDGAGAGPMRRRSH